MPAQLVPYDSLNALQRQQVEAIEIHPEQIKFSGDIHGALHTLLSKPGPGVKGFALLADQVPVAFLLLKRPPVLPAWPMNTAPPCTPCRSITARKARGMARPACKRCPTSHVKHGRRSKGWNCRWMPITTRRSRCTPNTVSSTAAKRTRAGSVTSGAWGCFLNHRGMHDDRFNRSTGSYLRPAHERAVRKQIGFLNEDYQAMVRVSPLVIVSSVGADGLDNSPRGDAPGFVRIIDQNTLALPDRPGNNRIDTLRNVLQDPRVSLLFIIPGSARPCGSTAPQPSAPILSCWKALR